MHISSELGALTRAPTVRDAPRTVILSMLTLALLASISADRDALAGTPRCELYPIPWQPADGAQTAAQAELVSLSPGARMTWNGNTGTLMSVLQLATPLPGCTDGQDVGGQVFDVLAAHPVLFQLDLADWRTPEPFDCKYLGDDEILSMGRRHLAGRPVAEDVFTYALKRIGGVVHLTAVNGTYLPVGGATMGDTMLACNGLTEAAATATARTTQLKATVLSQCRRTGTVTYTPKPNDVFSLSSDEAWTWQEDSGRVFLTGQRILRVTVDPANYTPGLISSDARCPVPGGDGHKFDIGFDITFDVHTGAIISVKPGLDCIVC
jgi:hypothetical protein